VGGVGLHVWVLDVTRPRLRAQPLASLPKRGLLRLGPQSRWRIGGFLAILAGVVALGGTPIAPARAAKPTLKPYVVQPGDTCWNIAERLYGSGKKYSVIHKYNDLGPMPHVLVPGTKLMLPLQGGGPDAQVDWVRRIVKAKPPRVPTWLDARVNMPLWRLYKLSTGDESAAHVVFEDTSELRLRDNALLVIYGSSARKTSKRKRPPKTTVVLDRGTLRGGLAALDAAQQGASKDAPAGSLVVKTKAAEVDLRRAVGQVDTGTADDTAVSVYAGEAKVAAQGATVDVPKDFGTFVEKGKKPEKPRPLPPRPKWATTAGAGAAGARALVPIVPGALGAFQGRWEPVKRAARYRFELARDRAFKRVIVDATVGAGVTAFRAEDLQPGTYYARVAAIDRRRLEGKPAHPIAVEVRPVKLSRLPTRGADGVWEVQGPTRLALGRVDGLEMRLTWRPEGSAADEEPGSRSPTGGGPPEASWQPSDGVARLKEPGWYRVDVRVAGGPVAGFDVHVLGVRATLALADPTAPPLEPGVDGSARVVVEARDTRGEPTTPLGLALVAEPGGELALAPRSPGRFEAAVPAPPAGHRGPVRLTLRWAAGVLARAEVPVAAPAVAPPPPPAPAHTPFGWTASPGVARWDRRGAAMEAPSVRAVRQVGLEVAVRGADPAAEGDRDTHLGVAVSGTWASRDHRAGVSGRVTLWRPALSADPASSSMLGDVEVGTRYAVVATPRWGLAPALRLRLPTAPQGLVGGEDEAAPSRRWGGELGLVAAAHAGEVATFTAREGVAAWADFQTATQVDLVGTYAVTLRPTPWLETAAQLDTLLGLSGDDRRGAFGLTGAVRARLDEVRVGLFVGSGLGAPGRQRLGSLVGGLTLELGYGAGLPPATRGAPSHARSEDE